MIGPTRSKIISQNNNSYTSHNPTPCSDIGDISDVGKEEGSEEGRDSPTIKQTQNIHKNISKTEKVKKMNIIMLIRICIPCIRNSLLKTCMTL